MNQHLLTPGPSPSHQQRPSVASSYAHAPPPAAPPPLPPQQSSLEANGPFVHAGYAFEQQQQQQYQQPGSQALHGTYTAAFGAPALGYPGQHYATANGSTGLEWDNATNQFATNGYYSLDPTLHLKLQSLPMLDNLATQIIATFTRSSFPDIVNFVTRPENDKGQAYATLKALFEDTKRIYSRDNAFLNHTLLGLHELQQQDTIRKANLATFMSSIFGNSNEVNVYYLHNNFLDTFVPYGSRMLKWHAALFLELKTQAYISAVFNRGMPRDDMIQDLFPPDMNARLLARRPDAKQLLPAEQEFITRMSTRRYYLLAENSSPQTLTLLARKYDWTGFLKEFSTNISKNLEGSSSFPPRTNHTTTYPDVPTYKDAQYTSGPMRPQIQTDMPPPMHTPYRTPTMDTQDTIGQAAIAAHAALLGPANGGFATLSSHHPAVSPTPSSDSRPHNSLLRSASTRSASTDTPSPILSDPAHPLYVHGRPPSSAPTSTPTTTNPSKTPSSSTTITNATSSTNIIPSTTPTTHPSPRRPWTPEEETALLAGLERVGGPHWSAILALYGAGGTLSEVLKDRNQVQLKDKARNLKLWFLKGGREVPPSLKGVTGELKTKEKAGGGTGLGIDGIGGGGAGGGQGEGRKQSVGSGSGGSSGRSGSSVSEGSSAAGKRAASGGGGVVRQAKRPR